MSISNKDHERPCILVTNDDGITSPAMASLVKVFADSADVIVSAPQSQQSGVGKGLLYRSPLRVRSIRFPHAVEALAVDGTPAAAVLFAIRRPNAKKVDMVVSGINTGFNASVYNVFVSGTLGAAIEGALLGIPSIAMSMSAPSKYWFDVPDVSAKIGLHCQFARKIVHVLLEKGFPPSTDLININFPAEMDKKTPVYVTPLSRRTVLDRPEARKDVYGSTYYWFGPGGFENVAEGTDLDILLHNKGISVSPITLRLTGPKLVRALKNKLSEDFNVQ
ncbi:MAG: 5'/3'-nucleotidase SurE [Candidatus Ranarchaeia archaeon]